MVNRGGIAVLTMSCHFISEHQVFLLRFYLIYLSDIEVFNVCTYCISLLQNYLVFCFKMSFYLCYIPATIPPATPPPGPPLLSTPLLQKGKAVCLVDVIVREMLSSHAQCLLLMYSDIIDSCMFILYPECSLNSFLMSLTVNVNSLTF